MNDKKLYNEWLDYRTNLIMRGETWLRFDEWFAAGRPNGNEINVVLDLKRAAKELEDEKRRHDETSRRLSKCMDALREIAFEDYRGGKPASAYVAERALKYVGSWHIHGGKQ